MNFTIELATPADDPAIRRLLAENPMPGQITITFEREPNYFLGCGTMGPFCQVVVARHQPTSDLAGIFCRAVRPLFVNGQVEAVGYLSQLRIAERFQGRWLVPQGVRYLQQLHADQRVAGYLAAIIEGNQQATGILVDRPRRGYPLFQPACHLRTLALILRRPQRIPPSVYHVSHGSTADLGEIIALFRQHGAAKQFFPAYIETDFIDSPLTRGFDLEDMFLARRQGKLVGVMGLWDQSAYKQSVIQGYSGALGRFRLLYNFGLRLIGAQPLLPPGEKIQSAYAGFICIAHNQPEIFQILLRHVYNLAAERGLAYLMVGLAENDPLLAVARRYWHIPYRSRLYAVGWEHEPGWMQHLDNRIPYIEIAAL
ncbi:MAG: hypothetical protein JXM69_12465 [Anaerolineae bacterium]|nr:hypothetical protein [Anaerolineae bacterium]